MIDKKAVLAILVIAIAALGVYFLTVKDVGDVLRNDGRVSEQEAEKRAIDETVEFVSFFDKIHPDKIKVANIEKANWPDSCLGLSQDGEICAQAIVPGYRIVLDADGITMVFRTNANGSSIRRDLAAEKVDR